MPDTVGGLGAPLSIPSCFLPNAGASAYNLAGGFTPSGAQCAAVFRTGRRAAATAAPAPAPAGGAAAVTPVRACADNGLMGALTLRGNGSQPELGADVRNLTLTVENITPLILRTKISAPGRWEVPRSLLNAPNLTGARRRFLAANPSPTAARRWCCPEAASLCSLLGCAALVCAAGFSRAQSTRCNSRVGAFRLGAAAPALRSCRAAPGAQPGPTRGCRPRSVRRPCDVHVQLQRGAVQLCHLAQQQQRGAGLQHGGHAPSVQGAPRGPPEPLRLSASVGRPMS